MKNKLRQNNNRVNIDPQTNLGKLVIIHTLVVLDKIKELCRENNLLLLELHKCDSINSMIYVFNKFNNDKRTMLIFMIALCDNKALIDYAILSKISSKDIELFYMSNHLSSNHFEGKIISDMIDNDGKLSECSICMIEKIKVDMMVCTKCKYMICMKCHNKLKQKCPICDR